MSTAGHECVFPEEREPDGRLILAPCLTCDLSALEALGQAKAQAQSMWRAGAPEDAMVISRVTVVRYLSGEGTDLVVHQATDGQGDALAIVESLGLLRLTEDSVIREAMGEVPDDDADD